MKRVMTFLIELTFLIETTIYDSDINIEAATILLRRISDRIDRPDAAKIGSIWQYTGREKTNEFGEYIGKIYKEKPWKIID